MLEKDVCSSTLIKAANYKRPKIQLLKMIVIYYLQHKRVQKVTLGLLILAIFLIYWLVSRQYTGPAYLSDEIGYLSKAAAFAGYPVDMASDWHGGYSIILSPLFMVFSDPYVIWQAIMVLNAAMWAVSFVVLFYLLRRLFPEKNFWMVFATVAISAVYPSWITMSGYAFSTPGFVLMFMLAVFTLLKTDVTKTWSILPHSLLVAFLYWIHPTGLTVAVASFLVVSGLAWYHRRFMGLLLHIIFAVAMVAAYQLVVHDWFSQIMTPENYSVRGHYESLSRVLESFLKISFWKRWVVITLGQLSYLLVSTLGVVFIAVIEVWKRLKLLRANCNQEWLVLSSAALVFVVFSLLGIVLIGSLHFATVAPDGVLRTDHWIYGRYSEVALLPFLGTGFLAFWRFKYAFSAASFVFASGLLLNLYSNGTNTSAYNNLVNISSFWPQAIFHQESFILWFIIGALGIILAGVLKKRLFVLLAIPLFLACTFNQNIFHENILSNYSNPSDLVKLVRSNFEQRKFVGFEYLSQQATDYQKERLKLYSYYFFNYNYRRMSPEEWLANSDGPYLTYHPEVFANSQDARVIAKEVTSGLFLVVKKHVLDNLSIKINPSTDLYVNLLGDNASIISGCFKMMAFDLQNLSQVGNYIDGKLITNAENGYLFYGPYVPLKRGDYYIHIDAQFINPEGALLDITSDKGRTKHLNINLADYIEPHSNVIKIPFSLESDVNDLEVRLHVNSATELKFSDYSINLNKCAVLMPKSITGSFLNYRGNNVVLSQVGTHTGSGMKTDGRAGYLMYGPYRPMDAGEYILQVTGEIRANAEHAVVDVVDQQGTVTFARFEGLETNSGVLLKKRITLDKPAKQIEVRVWVDDKADITITGYTLSPAKNE